MKDKILENLELRNDEEGCPVSASDLFLITEVVIATLDGIETQECAIKGDKKKGLMDG